MECWFEWNGKKCTEYGIRAVEMPPISFAKERATWKDVPGRSGSLTIVEGKDVYEDLTLSIDCRVENAGRIAEIGNWLRGGGELRLSNRTTGVYRGRISNQIELSQIVSGHENLEFTVNFRCQPFLYLLDAPAFDVLQSGTAIRNTGTVASAPRMEITGSGDFCIAISGGGAMQLAVLKDVSGGIVLDSELMDALSLDGSQLLNDHMDGDFPLLPAGDSVITWSSFDGNDNPGTVTKIHILPRWRCR